MILETCTVEWSSPCEWGARDLTSGKPTKASFVMHPWPFHEINVLHGRLNRFSKVLCWTREQLWSLLQVYDHQWKIMSYNAVKRMTYSATTDLNVGDTKLWSIHNVSLHLKGRANKRCCCRENIKLENSKLRSVIAFVVVFYFGGPWPGDTNCISAGFQTAVTIATKQQWQQQWQMHHQNQLGCIGGLW